jgi:cardiolipin synthase
MVDNIKTVLAFYKRPGDVWEAMYDDCANAKKSIAFEQYIVCNDEIGQRFLELFARKAGEGVAIDLLFDSVGSSQVVNSPFIEKIRSHGGRVRFYRPIKWLSFRPSRWLPRNHTKSMLIDSRIAYVGGVCLADYMKDWRDLHVKITGPLCEGVRENIMQPEKKGRTEKPSRATDFSYVVSTAHMRASPVYKELLLQIRQAKVSIYLVTPYFLPPIRLRLALVRAAKSGIDVRVMTTQKSDVPIASLVSRSYFPAFLRKGVSILAYQGVVLHAKYAVIDGTWATLGSTNMDYLSLIRNREANILINDGAAIETLKADFLADIERCEVLKLDVWKRTPFVLKLVGYAARPFKKMM